MLSAGREVDRYVVEGVLGRGGMAEVYKVRHSRLNSVHALKVLTLSSRGLRSRLLQEGQAQASLKHPNVVAVTDVLDIDGQPGLVMEYVEGPSLDAWLATNAPDIETALGLFRGIVSAVDAAHDAGLVHRDLKPANVLLAPVAGELVPKVMDFGLAKALAEEHVGHGATRSGIAMGTPRYMAPEQIRDAKSVDRRADLFSLGCLLYELLAGDPPFDGPDVLSVFNRVSVGSYVPAIEVVPGLPVAIDTAIRGCIVVDPAQRIPDCATLLRVLDGEAFTPPPIPDAGAPPPGLDSSETWAGGEVPQLSPSQPTLDLGRDLLEASGDQTLPPQAGDTLIPPGSPQSGSSESRAPDPTRRKLGWLAAGGTIAALTVLVVLVGLVVAVVGGWFGLQRLHASAIRRGLATATDGAAHVDRVQLQLGGLVVHGVSIQGRDGLPIVQADRIRLSGPGVLWSGPSAARRVDVDGLDIDLRRDSDGWVLPERTLAVLQGDGPGASLGPVDVHVGATRLIAQGTTGTLTGRVAGADIAGLSRGPNGWSAALWELHAPALSDHMPIFEARSIRAEGTTARIDGMNVWLTTRAAGWLDLPPMVADGVPVHFGGTASGATWFGALAQASPVPLEAVQVDAGVVHVIDTANADDEVEWAASFDQARLSRSDDGWRLAALGELDRGRLSLDFGPGTEGQLQGRVEVRDLPLVGLAPYLGATLAERGVAIGDGVVDGVIDVEEREHALGFVAALEVEAPVLVPIADDPSDLTRRERRLLVPRESVSVSVDGIGMLTDMDFRPFQELRQATAAELLAPAGRASRARAAAGADDASPGLSAAKTGSDVDAEQPDDAASGEPEEVPETVRERWQRRRKESQQALEDWFEKRTGR